MLLVLAACGRGNFDALVDATSTTADVAIDTSQPVAVIGDLTDDFGDGALGSFWDTYTGTSPGTSSFAETGGALVVTLGDTVADTYAGYVTAVGYDTRGRAAVVHVLETSSVMGANCYLSLVATAGTQAYGMVATTTVVQAMQDDIAFYEEPFVLAQRSWWRIREAAGTLSFETSPDGRTWTAFATLPSPSYVGDVKPNLGGGNYQVVTSPGQCRFDDFGRPPQ